MELRFVETFLYVLRGCSKSFPYHQLIRTIALNFLKPTKFYTANIKIISTVSFQKYWIVLKNLSLSSGSMEKNMFFLRTFLTMAKTFSACFVPSDVTWPDLWENCRRKTNMMNQLSKSNPFLKRRRSSSLFSRNSMRCGPSTKKAMFLSLWWSKKMPADS